MKLISRTELISHGSVKMRSRNEATAWGERIAQKPRELLLCNRGNRHTTCNGGAKDHTGDTNQMHW
jgi:hypothetical protein